MAQETIELHPGLRDELDATFKPIFDEHEESGIPLRVLRDRLRAEGATKHFPPGKLDYLLKKADQDADGRLDYEEFVRIVITSETSLLTQRQLTQFQKLVRASVSSVVPKNAKGRSGDYVVDDYISHYNCKPPPLFMIIISITEVIVFIVYAVELRGTKQAITATSGVPLYSPFIYNPARRYEAWRFLTYMLLHQGYLHLIFNLIFQLMLGIPLEMVHKWWRVGIVYSLGVIAGALGHSVIDTHTMLAGASGGCYALIGAHIAIVVMVSVNLDYLQPHYCPCCPVPLTWLIIWGSLGHSVTDHNTLLAGASGGCYSLIGAHIAIVIMNWKEMTHDWLSGPVRFVLSAPVRLVVWTLLAGIDTGMSIYNRYAEGSGNIGYAAHFAGALAGLLVGIPVLKNIDKKPWEEIVWWIALIAYLICVIFAVGWNTFYPHYPPTDWRKCCPSP